MNDTGQGPLSTIIIFSDGYLLHSRRPEIFQAKGGKLKRRNSKSENNLDVSGKHFVWDSGFDAAWIRDRLIDENFVPVIKPGVILRKNKTRTNEILDEFEPQKYIYKGRVVNERTFAWEDTCRKLTTRYEKLNCTFNGFRYLAYAMINFRWLFGKNL